MREPPLAPSVDQSPTRLARMELHCENLHMALATNDLGIALAVGLDQRAELRWLVRRRHRALFDEPALDCVPGLDGTGVAGFRAQCDDPPGVDGRVVTGAGTERQLAKVGTMLPTRPR